MTKMTDVTALKLLRNFGLKSVLKGGVGRERNAEGLTRTPGLSINIKAPQFKLEFMCAKELGIHHN